uniref:Uncharacterized protein n=1 Tax=Eutreptiella gymnastica TaxID=73025 RepID=A0A7S4G3Y5_9EUGL
MCALCHDVFFGTHGCGTIAWKLHFGVGSPQILIFHLQPQWLHHLPMSTLHNGKCLVVQKAYICQVHGKLHPLLHAELHDQPFCTQARVWCKRHYCFSVLSFLCIAESLPCTSDERALF